MKHASEASASRSQEPLPHLASGPEQGWEEKRGPSAAFSSTCTPAPPNRKQNGRGLAFSHLLLDQSFETLALLVFWARQSLVVGGRFVLCRIFSCISGLYPLDTSILLLPRAQM